MKIQKLAIALLFVITLSPVFSQLTTTQGPHIEVTGTARMDIMPDEIYVSITIRERVEGKENITVESQEANLKKGLESVGISLEQLSLSDSETDYVRIRRRKTEVISSKQYMLKLSTAEEVSKTFEKLDELEIEEAYITKTDRSDIVELKKDLRIKAIKAAKDKADYLLESIGEKTGHALEVRENDPNYYYGYNTRSMANSIQYYSNGEEESDDMRGVSELGFEKIRLEASIYVKFEIDTED